MHKKEQIFYFSALAFVSPLLVAFLSIKSVAWNVRKPVLILLITLFGSTIILNTSDGSVFIEIIHDHYVDISFSQWFNELKDTILLKGDSGTKGDVFFHVFAYLFGSIIGIPKLFFTFVSFLYAWFFISSMSKILVWDQLIRKDNLFWAIIIIFVSYRFIDNLQTVRTWTGLWVLFYGVYQYHQTKKIKYLFLMLTAPLFHFAYFIMALPAYAVVFFKRLDPKIFIVTYLLSFMININPGGIIETMQSTEVGENKVAGYYREDPDDYGLGKYEQGNFYASAGKFWALSNAPHFLAFTIIIFGVYSKKRMSSLELGIFSTGILMATMANILDFIPAVYMRTMSNAGIYITATTVLLLLRGELWNTNYLAFRRLCLWGCVLVFSPYVIYVLANMLQFTSIFMLALPMLGFNEETNLSIRQLIGFFM